MKKLSLAFTILAMSAGTALSADLAARPYAKAPAPMIAAVYDWSGFYIGINGGGGSSHKCWDRYAAAVFVAGEGCHNATGGTVGGQLGYRWQSANWVFGLEGQGNWASFSGDNISLFDATQRDRTRIDSFGLITGQIGYAWSNVLFYVKGGAAVVGDKYDVFSVATGAKLANENEARWGAAVGAGLEFGFAPDWTLGFEYDHMFLGSRTLDLHAPAIGTAFVQSDRISQGVDVGLIRVNYRFGGPGIAKY